MIWLNFDLIVISQERERRPWTARDLEKYLAGFFRGKPEAACIEYAQLPPKIFLGPELMRHINIIKDTSKKSPSLVVDASLGMIERDHVYHIGQIIGQTAEQSLITTYLPGGSAVNADLLKSLPQPREKTFQRINISKEPAMEVMRVKVAQDLPLADAQIFFGMAIAHLAPQGLPSPVFLVVGPGTSSDKTTAPDACEMRMIIVTREAIVRPQDQRTRTSAFRDTWDTLGPVQAGVGRQLDHIWHEDNLTKLAAEQQLGYYFGDQRGILEQVKPG